MEDDLGVGGPTLFPLFPGVAIARHERLAVMSADAVGRREKVLIIVAFEQGRFPDAVAVDLVCNENI
jgi:hypothetical protein